MLKKIKSKIKKITNHPRFISFLGIILYHYSIFIGKTTRWKTVELNELNEVWQKEKAIISITWHGRALMLPYFWNKKLPINALVSMHNDGKIISTLLKKYGFGVIEGSTTSGGKEAAIKIKTSLEKNEAICIIPDGPIGPRMKMNDSPLYFAKKTGKPIIATTYSISNSFIAKSWDAMMFPLPFQKGIVYATKPYYIPKDASKEDLEKYKLEIEEEMNAITHRADKRMGIAFIESGVRKKNKRYNKEGS